MNLNRIITESNDAAHNGSTIYWMSRDQRVQDNWALLYAADCAEKTNCNLAVVFCLVPDFNNAGLRQYHFMLQGLAEVKKELEDINIPFILLNGEPTDKLPEFIAANDVTMVVTDFDPLKIKRKRQSDVFAKSGMNYAVVDAHNIVPVTAASEKLEFAARTIRPKIHKLIPEYLEDFPQLKPLSNNGAFNYEERHPIKALDELEIDDSVGIVDSTAPGTVKAFERLEHFLKDIIHSYEEERNDPNKNALSGMSPYLHFGQISAQRIAYTVEQFYSAAAGRNTFLEELIVRKELSDNFCFYNINYDSFNGFHEWAQKTLNERREDEREYIYTPDEFEKAETHDSLWNAAQAEMVTTGKMHGYMRMYWAKKILEWTASPEEALKTAIYLNDKYELDGRDPNGYTGCAWAIGGVHDRAWTERRIFGKVRYMNYNGCRRKFDVDEYINRFIPDF